MITCDECQGRGRDQKGSRCFLCAGYGRICEKCDEHPGDCQCDAPPPDDTPTVRQVVVSNLPTGLA